MAEVEIRLEGNRTIEFEPVAANQLFPPKRVYSTTTILGAKAGRHIGAPVSPADLLLIDETDSKNVLAVELKTAADNVVARGRQQARDMAAKLQRSMPGARVTPQLWELDWSRGSLQIWSIADQPNNDTSLLYRISSVRSEPGDTSGDDATGAVEKLDTELVQRRVLDWQGRVAGLFEQVRNWLAAGNGELTVDTQSTTRMHEELMRKFAVEPVELPILQVLRNKRSILTFKPYGLWVVGANGRVDITGTQWSGFMVDTANHFEPARWYVYGPGTLMHGVPFDRPALEKLLPKG